MTEPVGLRPLTVARVLHAALTIGPFLIAGIMWFVLRGRLVVSALNGTPGYALYGLTALGLAFGAWWRSEIPGRSGGEESSEYWRRVLPRVFALYALLEGVAVLGTLVALLAGKPVTALAILLVYATQMLLYSPSRLAGD